MTTVTVTTINELSAVWAPLLWKASWQGGLALLLILVISLAVRKVPAHIQCWLWRLAQTGTYQSIAMAEWKQTKKLPTHTVTDRPN